MAVNELKKQRQEWIASKNGLKGWNSCN